MSLEGNHDILNKEKSAKSSCSVAVVNANHSLRRYQDDLGSYSRKLLKISFPGYSSLAVLEGIAIGFNPDYKVLGSTYPWIARKVLTDSSPQLKSTLKALLYEVNLQALLVSDFLLFQHYVYPLNIFVS